MANTTADKLAKLAETKSSIKQAIIDKGVSVSDTDTFASYAGKIGQISGGGIPSYVPPKDNVNGVYKNPNTATTFSLNGATDVGDYALHQAFYSCTNLTSVDLSTLTTISGSYAMRGCFYGCTGLTSVDLSALSTVSGGSSGAGLGFCFTGCTNLTSVNLSSLTTVSGSDAMNSCFSNCRSLTSVDFPALTTVAGTASYYSGMLSSCFYGCENLTSVSFPVLATLGSSGAMGSCFQHCKALPKISFPALTTIHKDAFGQSYNPAFSGCTALTEIHFRADAREAVEAMTGYSNKWGATNATIYFDL